MCWSDAKKPKVEKIDPQRSRRSKTLNVRRVEIPGRFPKMSSETKLPVFTVLRHDAIIQIIRIPPSWFVITMIHTTNDNINHASAAGEKSKMSNLIPISLYGVSPGFWIFLTAYWRPKYWKILVFRKKSFFHQKSEKILFFRIWPSTLGEG